MIPVGPRRWSLAGEGRTVESKMIRKAEDRKVGMALSDEVPMLALMRRQSDPASGKGLVDPAYKESGFGSEGMGRGSWETGYVLNLT